MENKLSNYYWHALLAGLFAVLILKDLFVSHVSDSPRLKNGKDTIYSRDSVYVITFKIDTAYEYEPEQDHFE